MKAGRNDPCPCGSGKKYKKCCLTKESAAKDANAKDAKRREEIVKREYWDRFWRKFGAADYEEKTSIFHEYLDGPNVASDVVFDMLSALVEEARKRQDYKAFAGLVESVKAKRPEIYDKDASFYSWFIVENMASQGDFGDLPVVLEPFARNPERIDEFFRVIEILMYHAQTEPLIGAMREAHPKALRSPEIIPPGKDEFSTLLGWLIIFEGLERHTALDEFGRDVLEYWDDDKAHLEGLLKKLRGELSGDWQRADFLKGVRKSELNGKILDLTEEFMGWLRGRGMSYTRALLARIALVEYLLDDEHYSKVKRGSITLLPKKAALDRHLANYLDFLNDLPYRVAGLTEALPHYLAYLLHKGLIDEEEYKKEISAMKPLMKDVLNYFRPRSSVLGEGIIHAIEESWKGLV